MARNRARLAQQHSPLALILGNNCGQQHLSATITCELERPLLASQTTFWALHSRVTATAFWSYSGSVKQGHTGRCSGQDGQGSPDYGNLHVKGWLRCDYEPDVLQRRRFPGRHLVTRDRVHCRRLNRVVWGAEPLSDTQHYVSLFAADRQWHDVAGRGHCLLRLCCYPFPGPKRCSDNAINNFQVSQRNGPCIYCSSSGMRRALTTESSCSRLIAKYRSSPSMHMQNGNLRKAELEKFFLQTHQRLLITRPALPLCDYP